MTHQAARYSGARVAITGGSGYLASALRAALNPSGARVVVVSRRDPAPLRGEQVMRADVRTHECWTQILERADIVFHLAGNTSVYAAAADPVASLESTVTPVTHLIAAAARMPGRRVVYASTATVYGMTGDEPVGEDTPANPVTVYDLHKLCAEQHLTLASHRGLVDGVSLRLANVYGPSPNANSSDDRGVINRIARLALQGTELQLYGGGRYVRDYVYVDDVIGAFLAAGLRTGISGRAFNVAGGVGTTIRDVFSLVVQRAEKATGRRSGIRDTPWPDGADPIEFRHFTADISRFATACEWRPLVGLPDGVDRLVRQLVTT